MSTGIGSPGPLAASVEGWSGRGAGSGGLNGVRAVEQGLAAESAGDVAGFSDGFFGGLVIAQAEQVLGVVEQAVGEVVGGGVLAQAGDCGGERCAGVRAGFGGGEAGAG